MASQQRKVRIIAHYLPQYHPIPENDEWWEKGFTEWTHVTRAKPLFRGHKQPKFPADLGYYDLRLPESRIAQAELARQYGIEGFCYWHYWFAGRRILETPFSEVLESGVPDFPFCLAWANHSWSAAWVGLPDKVFLEQTYPGPKDYEAHFYALLPAFNDHRYITVDGKPLFIVFRPTHLPEPRQFADQWHCLAEKSGLKGIFIMGICCSPWDMSSWTPGDYGFDGCLTTTGLSPTGSSLLHNNEEITLDKLKIAIRSFFKRPVIHDYTKCVSNAFSPSPLPDYCFPAVLSNWDNTPRHGFSRGLVYRGCTPEAFRKHLRDGIDKVIERPIDHRLVFIRSWNEWAEGNYLEPDHEYGRAFLTVVSDEVNSCAESE
ncbi:glycoside hydrolase family 99-like domain-containing protein [bacterium]|nr:glycoside hydrolase family 99-like domain-containing protein [bacterium]